MQSNKYSCLVPIFHFFFVSTLGFTHGAESLLIYHRNDNTSYNLLYVDEIILVSSSYTLRQPIMPKL